ncbi:MAG: hypothetical protein ABI613_04790 [Gemmatimonadota bacterium]
MRTCLLPLAALFVLACGPDNRDVPYTALQQPTDSTPVPFTYIGNAAWLGGSRWAFLAPNERQVVLADIALKSTNMLGGKPGSYAEPFNIFRAGDSLYVGDLGKRSMTVWSIDGGFGRSIPATSFVRGAFPLARDAAGNFYSQLYPPPGADGSGNRDSTYVIRMSADFSRADTVAHLAPLDIAEVFGDAGRRFEPRALSGRDVWGVFPDGTLWIARVNQNRIDRRTPDGKWSEGDQLPDRVLQVLPQDRERFLATFPEELRTTAGKVPFAIIKPPFEDAYAGPEQRIYLIKSYSLADSSRIVQVVSPDGKLLQQLEYRGFGRMVGTDGTVGIVADAREKGHNLLVYRLPQYVAK